MITRVVVISTFSLLFSLLSGCGSSPPVYFYTLSVESAAATGSDMVRHTLRIAVGPVSIPEVIDRPQMVVRSGPHQVTLLEEHRWAESLNSEIPRVIAENLSRLLSTDHVWTSPQYIKGAADYKVSVDIQRFDSMPGQSVAIEALWRIRRVSGEGDESTVGRSNVQQPVSGQEYEALAEAHSRALAVISSEIADAIRLFAPPSS